MIKANVILDFSKWRYKIKNPNIYFKKKFQKLSTIPSFKNKNQEFSILLTNSKKIKSLNYKFKKINKPTDVLSFSTQNVFKNNSYIGDIAICFEILNKRSKTSNFFLEFDKMWIHGYFHLIGYDHKKLKDFERMSKKENSILQYFHKIN
jgi:probable rRNA maturation factor